MKSMKKYITDLRVVDNIRLNARSVLLKLTSDRPLPTMVPGQFVQLLVDDSPRTFLRRPISVNFVDKLTNTLWLLVQTVGEGTARLSQRASGDIINAILPLGNGFTVPFYVSGGEALLVGGGAGVAPLLYLGDVLRKIGMKPVFLLGAKSKDELVELSYFQKIGITNVTTEDGSAGTKGYVTDHSILRGHSFSKIYTCGPKPMMIAVARYAKETGADCEVSLENMMACGIGACLCCVEKTVKGNRCVCTEGPVFNINQLTWQI